MKKLMMAALAASTLLATPAMAATTASYDVTASVAAVCSISATGAVLDFGALTDASGNFSNTAAPETTDSAAYCNQASTKVAVSHTSLTNTVTAPTGFTNIVTYTPVLTTQATTLTGDQTVGAIGAFTTLKVKASSAAATGGAKLVAGSYTGAISITLTPAS